MSYRNAMINAVGMINKYIYGLTYGSQPRYSERPVSLKNMSINFTGYTIDDKSRCLEGNKNYGFLFNLAYQLQDYICHDTLDDISIDASPISLFRLKDLLRYDANKKRHMKDLSIRQIISCKKNLPIENLTLCGWALHNRYFGGYRGHFENLGYRRYVGYNGKFNIQSHN